MVSIFQIEVSQIMEKGNNMDPVPPSPSVLESWVVGSMPVVMLVAVVIAILSTTSDKPRASRDLHDAIEPYARNIKIVLQMLIGFVAVCIVILRAFSAYPGIASNPSNLFPFTMYLVSGVGPLDIVGVALAFSTAVELAYTLFTRGLDEAINPLIMGIAAAILIAISPPGNFKVEVMSAVALAVVVIAILFLIQRTLPREEPTGGVPLMRKLLKRIQDAIAAAVAAVTGQAATTSPDATTAATGQAATTSPDAVASDGKGPGVPT